MNFRQGVDSFSMNDSSWPIALLSYQLYQGFRYAYKRRIYNLGKSHRLNELQSTIGLSSSLRRDTNNKSS